MQTRQTRQSEDKYVKVCMMFLGWSSYNLEVGLLALVGDLLLFFLLGDVVWSGLPLPFLGGQDGYGACPLAGGGSGRGSLRHAWCSPPPFGLLPPWCFGGKVKGATGAPPGTIWTPPLTHPSGAPPLLLELRIVGRHMV